MKRSEIFLRPYWRWRDAFRTFDWDQIGC